MGEPIDGQEIATWSGPVAFGYRFTWRRSEYVIVEECPLDGWTPGKQGPRVPGTAIVAAHGRLRKAAPHWPARWPVGGVFAPRWWPRGQPIPARPYDPVEEAAEILRDVQRSAGDDPKALLRFVNRWGPLGVGVPLDRNFLDGVRYTGRKLSELKDWLEGLKALQQGRLALRPITPSWVATIDGIIERFEKQLETRRDTAPRVRVEDGGRTLVFPVPQMSRRQIKQRIRELQRDKRKPRAWTWKDIVFMLNENLREVRLGATRQKSSLVSLYFPNRLLEVLWLEAWKEATGVNRFRRCPECHVLFVPGRANQEYCTHLCANRPTVRRAKLRRKRLLLGEKRGRA